MISPRKFSTAFLGCIVSVWAFSQPFKPDSAGYISDPAFKTFLKKNGYQVSSTFRWMEGGKRAAIMAKDNHYTRVGLDGKEIVENSRMRAEEMAKAGEDWSSSEPESEYDIFRGPDKPENAGWTKFRSFKQGEYTGIQKADGQIILEAEYDECIIVDSYLIMTRKNDLWRLQSISDDRAISSMNYKCIYPFNASGFNTPTRFAVQAEDGKWGLLNNDAEEIIAPEYDTILHCRLQEEFYMVVLNRKKGLVNRNGRMYGGIVYDRIRCIGTKLFIATRKVDDREEIRLIKNSGSFSGAVYSGYYFFRPGILCIQTGSGTDRRFGFFSIEMFQEITPPVYSSVSKLYGGSAIVGIQTPEGMRYGYISKEMEELMAPVYDEVKPLENGIAVVRRNDRWGALNLKGDTILPFRYEDLAVLRPGNHHDFGFHSDAAFTYLEAGKWGALSASGRIVLQPMYDKVAVYDTEYMVTSNGLTGVVSSQNKIRIPLIYKELVYSQPGLYEIVRNGQHFLIDYYGGEMKLSY